MTITVKKGLSSKLSLNLTLPSFELEIVFIRREMRSISSRGPIAFSNVLIRVRKRTLKRKSHPSSVILAEFFPQNVLFDGWGGV